VFPVLTSLAGGSQHGYGIITDVRAISAGRVQLKAGTLYSALERLRADKLIEVGREEIVGSRLRRYYRLTPAQRAAGSRGGAAASPRPRRDLNPVAAALNQSISA
jgi:DNA-binding PadR family transcriptional regulator